MHVANVLMIWIRLSRTANATLTSLNLSDGSIGDMGVAAIAQALKINSALMSLHLCSCSFSDVGIVAIAQALKVNSTLTDLYLHYNVGEESACALADMLIVNNGLRALKLTDSEGSCVGRSRMFRAAIKYNVTLIMLNYQEQQNQSRKLVLKRNGDVFSLCHEW